MKFYLSAMAAAAALINGTALQAGSLAPACLPNSLAYYESSYGPSQCSVGILNFYNFTFGSSGSATLLSDSQILVTPSATNGAGGGFTIGAVDPLGAPFAVNSGETATYTIGWHFDIDPGPRGTDASLGMDPPLGDVTITQSYCNDSDFFYGDNGISCYLPGLFQPEASGSQSAPPVQTLMVSTIPVHLTDSLVFNPPAYNYANVLTTIVLKGDAPSAGCPTGSGGSCFDSTTGTTDVVSDTPEPFSFLLGFSGLAGMALLRRLKPQS